MDWKIIAIILAFVVWNLIFRKDNEKNDQQQREKGSPFKKDSNSSSTVKRMTASGRRSRNKKKPQIKSVPIKSKKLNFKIIDLEQGSEEWLDWRHSGIGASDASTVMGDNRFQSPDQLLHQKINKINVEPNEKMRLGTELEPEARDLYIKETGINVKPLCLQSKKYSWLIVSMDGITDDYQHIVEIKCGRSAYWQARKDIVPNYYYGQLQHQMMVTGLNQVDYWCYWPGQKGILQTVLRDDKYIDVLLKKEKNFIKQLLG